jgi:hypothetical protein
MTTRQSTLREMVLLILLLAIVAAAQAELTYPHLIHVDGWVVSSIFGVVYAFIGGTFAIRASSPRTL